METRTFKSTNVEKATYDSSTFELTITFDGGRKYRYYRVPSSIWQRLKKTDSVGRFVNEELQQFGYRRL